MNNAEYLQSIDKNVDGSVSKKDETKLILPYNIMYSIYPRCAYNDEDDVALIFMMRCPTIGEENKYAMTSDDVKIGYIESDIYNASQLNNHSLNVNIN